MQPLYAQQQPPAEAGTLLQLRRLLVRLALVLLHCASAGSAHAHGHDDAAALALSLQGHVADTAGHLQRLDDAAGTMDAAQADRNPDWQPVPDRLNASYTDATVWLRLRLQVHEPGQWMLLLSNALLDDVQMFARGPDGAWRSLGRNGEDTPRALWPVSFRSPALQLDMDQAGE